MSELFSQVPAILCYTKLPSPQALLSIKMLPEISTDLTLSCKNFSKIFPARFQL